MNMDDSWHTPHTANGRYMTDQYRPLQNQWMMHPQQIKDLHNTTALMKIIAEQTNAIQERNLALSEKKVALAERDMVILQRDTAIAERDNAIMERDNAIAALEFARQKMNGNEKHASPDMQYPPLQLSEAPINHTRGMHISEALTIFEIVQQSKQRRKEIKTEAVPSKKASKSLGKNKRVSGMELNDAEGSRGRKRQASSRKHDEGKKDQDTVVSSQVIKFDESTMPPPVCSCTGKLHQCYKWGNGGWQSACCTPFVSRYPLPSLPDKPHARVGGRKMSTRPFAKLLSRLVAEGHDLSTPLDLKDHWARHGTNRYITIK